MVGHLVATRGRNDAESRHIDAAETTTVASLTFRRGTNSLTDAKRDRTDAAAGRNQINQASSLVHQPPQGRRLTMSEIFMELGRPGGHGDRRIPTPDIPSLKP